MATIAFNNFDGEIPKLPPTLLPESGAQKALNCDFTQNYLAALKQGSPISATFATNPVRSLYTEDGINFFAWTTDAYPFKAPVVNDSFQRIYFMNGAVPTVAELATATASNCGPPATSYKVGVPFPPLAPTVQTVDRTTFSDYPSAVFSFSAWYAFNGVHYDTHQPLAASTIALKEWTVVLNAPSSTTDPSATPTVEITLKNGSDTLFVLDTTADNALPASSLALPGGLEVYLKRNSDTSYTLTIRWGAIDTRAYIYTVTNTYNEESAPSLPAVIAPTYVQDVQVGTLTAPSFTGYKPFQGINVYRTFGTGTTYLQIATNIAAGPYTDSSHTPTGVTSALISTDFFPPPASVSGFGSAPNGICWCFTGNTMSFCEPYRPHAWPYNMSFRTNIRGVQVSSQNIVVTTADGVYAVTGTHSAAMTQIKLAAPQPGISTRSSALVEGAVVYASNDGLVYVSGSQADLSFSHKYFNRANWRTRYGSILSPIVATNGMRLAYHDGQVVGTSPLGLGFIIRTDEADDSYTQMNIAIDSTYYAPMLDTLYYAQGTSVYEFRGSATPYTYDWQSKDFIFPKHVSFAIGYARTSGAVTVTLYADGVLYTTISISGTGYFRIPSGLKALRWSVELTGTSDVYELYIASSVTELQAI